MQAAWRAIRDRLKADAAIAAYFQERYPESPLNLYLGYRANRTGAEFPYLAVVPTQAVYTRWPSLGAPGISIIVGVNEPDIEDGESLGLIRLDEIFPLVLAPLAMQPLSTDPQVLWLGQARTITDMGVTHPYYEGEVALQLELKP